MRENEMDHNLDDYIEIEIVEYKKSKIRLWSLLAFLLLLLVPLIIYDSMGYADYFKLNSGVSLDDDKMIRFIFGILYFIRKLPTRGFLPAHLFSGMARLVCGVSADNTLTVILSELFLIVAILAIITPLASFIMCSISIKRGTEKSKKLDKVLSVLNVCLFILIALVQLVVITTLLVKLGLPNFKLDDFLAYGAVKYTIEFVVSVLLAFLNARLLLEVRKD